MNPNNYYYLTTTLPYVNAAPHIGFALEIVTADVLARFNRLLGHSVIFNTGTDEHGLKIYQLAQKAGLSAKDYADQNAAHFKKLNSELDLSFTHFIRTTDPDHIKAAKEFWRLCQKNGDIYRKLYQVKYCVGCELEKTESELVDGFCPLHPGKPLEIIEEENYFFRFSRYQDALLKLYTGQPDFVVPPQRLSEIKAFVAGGLNDFSISRLKAKMPWGIPVPDDPDQVMYVWFDALVNYISTLGWPQPGKDWERFWPGVQIAGKDNLRQQAAMWQAMLLSAGLPPSRQILINGFIGVDGQKMSKSLGNVISPSQMIERFGIDATRYLLLRLGPVGEDSDASWDKFTHWYHAFLSNSLGNTVQRVATLAARSGFDFTPDTPPGFRSQLKDTLDSYHFTEALDLIWQTIKNLEQIIDEKKPWTLTGPAQKVVLTELIAHLRQVGYELTPFMPQTADKITAIFNGPKINPPEPLFPRLNI